MIKSVNKRGQELGINTLIFIVIGLIVLVILVFGFTKGWSFLKKNVPEDNVAKVAFSCETACNLESVYDYCTKAQGLKDPVIKDEAAIVLAAKSCNALATEDTKYGIVQCTSITCPTS